MATNATAARNILDRVQSGQKDYPERYLLHGVEGIGKSTFASQAPNPLVLCAEDGLGPELAHVKRFVPSNWEDVLELVNTLINQKHNYETLVIDTIDWLEALIHYSLCQRDAKDTIEDYGYGKGYTIAVAEMRRLLARLDQLRQERGMGIIILAHSAVRTFTNPTGDNYDRYEMKCNKLLSGLVREWCDIVLFARYEVFVEKGNKKATKGKAFGDARIMHTTWAPSWDAKNRHSLPEVIPLSWDDFQAARAESLAGGGSRAVELASWIVENWDLVEWPTPDAADKTIAFFGLKAKPLKAEDLAKVPTKDLQRMADRLSAHIPKQE